MLRLSFLLSLALIPAALGSCPNSCSGHGSCGNDDVCTCYKDWMNGDEEGGDCSQRKCPYEIAWVDTPSSSTRAHRLAECAGRGICDRETGDCACFEGFTGKGCRRTTCPNGCSGHGTCEYISELRNDLGDDFKLTGSQPTTNQYEFEAQYLWDYHKSRACVCDPKWTDVDCSRRMCPKGNYALYANAEPTPETQAILITNVFTTDDTSNGEFALTFRSTLNEEFTTYTLSAFNLTAEAVEDALNSLPNKVIEEAEVEVMANGTNSEDLLITVTYSGAMTSGDQYALECRSTYCGAGCQPRLANALGLNNGTVTCTVLNDYSVANAVNTECSGRGRCDYEIGVCECFEGYTDEFCSTQTALI
mmetsp:Transcript_14116/g.20650  ORF Transcript_14116/g.20650 Transcript_14116/m.20650 type:complete len:362 (-) Transcript_14116:329-1414(-)|eukprot:CAMPEP_0202436136 /NCGR_PEP_ID=MMETSP1345-20130828/23185_1 /ASSEMBLY_ACC=CAM_ASM_000843 /TAXON_ID=342563 /ORGANISM="Fabrea Fabrea salina" /LENGTH=361 /DNA_ID=CAMNT_0049049413 /DNA_START=38 /DNA_END=1123 /DNA_ORIENTATION=-